MRANGDAARVVVAGFGSEFRHDDGVGPLVAEQAVAQASLSHNVGPLSDPLDLLGVWNNADLVVVVDAVSSGAPTGSVQTLELDVEHVSQFDSDAQPVAGLASTHGIGLAGVLRLARALGQAPQRLVVVGIEGERFDIGQGLSEKVRAAVPEAVQRVVDLIEEAQ
ncbi:MAG: hydrogenase maturation protease [Acidimicrobiales bacterium]|jgi:hydrogenase maturation protease